MTAPISAVTLEGRLVRLEPLIREHADAFYEAAHEWNLTREAVQEGIERALALQAAGTALPFATVAKASETVVGGTRFLNINLSQRRLEIGSSWLGAPWRRTGINTEAKYLMLRHAFEALGFIRVEFLADAANEVSRRAILRLGALEEGTLRSYFVQGDGSARDAVMYSIIESDWPAVKSRLEELMFGPYPTRRQSSA